MKMRQKSGFTIAELTVAMLIASLVMALVWEFFIGERRRFESDQDRLSGLQGALSFDEYLAADLERVAVNLPDSPDFTYEHPVDTGDGHSLSLVIADSDDPAVAKVRPIAVSYRFDAASGQVLRSAGSREKALTGLVAEDVLFSCVPANVVWPAGSAPVTGQKAPLQYVRYTLSCLPEGQRNLPVAERAAHRRITLVGAVALRPRSERKHHEYWRLLPSELVATP